ncbi:hypothetical protein N7492_006026 [Penicillium capsulatum]|uniref:Uncharacterized protein n=1 Tax=Penicillium capsulatum TaxID=69766 RepID=A0A9W9ID39_9EURO|nr:hypothetical protein N7492_006026 [Penicillium capsulatum]KAJ6134870.1 hypothetical protein N7512_000030 [Penicillium capsulatum]
MATTHGTTTHLPAGSMATALITPEEVHEYEAILKIRDQIFSGSHPRLKVPQQLVRQPGARSGSNTSPNQQAGKSRPSAVVPVNPIAVETNPAMDTSSTAPAKAVPPSRSVPKPTSEIDPIFLTKSDDLVRAELQLQRQRVERTLRDQLEQRKQCPRSRPALHDLKPDFNVSDVLDKALEIVRPVSLSDPSETNGPNDSFDDNSFYSSRAPDSPAPNGDPRASSPTVFAQATGSVVRAPIDRFTDELQRLEALNHPGSDQEMQDAYHAAHQGNLYSQKKPHSGQAEAARRIPQSQPADSIEEPEYSPPAPGGPPIDPRGHERGVVRSGGKMRHVDQTRPVQGPTSPSHNVRVVRNHITSPAAPRPSRVSPLAMTKVPSVHQVRDEGPERYSDRVPSEDPELGPMNVTGPGSRILSRKRRKVQGQPEAHRPSHQRQGADPLGPYIKEEPVSPPPFADDVTVVRGRDPRERVYIDIASPQYTPVAERRDFQTPRPIYEVDSYHDASYDPGIPRTVSRVSTRRPMREEGDLRRVASMQYARQADHPRGYIAIEPHGSRAPAYAMEQPSVERSRCHEEVPAYGPRYIAVDDLYPPTYREPYYDEPPPRPVQAPQRRIVVDEHGNEYEMIPRMQSMAPPPRPMSRVRRSDVYDDRIPARTASVRAPSVIQDPYADRRYAPEMPPPPSVYRRVPAEYIRPVSGDRRTYAAPMEDPEPYTHEGAPPVTDYAPRPTYIEEHALPAERGIRTTSIRPPSRRYEEPLEGVARMGSVRPVGRSREISTYIDERSLGDYAERPYYVREPRYYEGDDGTGPSAEPAPRRY